MTCLYCKGKGAMNNFNIEINSTNMIDQGWRDVSAVKSIN